ncbi:MAG: hypothetical protein M5U34_46350 [Chloroflexi bacterium]|nr:hypothetical protein [Chloroflexota bacterium]
MGAEICPASRFFRVGQVSQAFCALAGAGRIASAAKGQWMSGPALARAIFSSSVMSLSCAACSKVTSAG